MKPGSIVNQKFITLGLFTPLFFILLVKNKIKLKSLFGRPIIRWLLAYFSVSVCAFVFALIFNKHVEDAYDALRAIIFSVLIVVLITAFLDKWERFYYAQRCLIGGMIFSVIMNIMGFFQWLPISKTAGRASGFFLNPNSASITLCFGLVLVTKAVPPRWRTIFVFFVGVGIVLTFSRAGVFFYVLYILYYIFIQEGLNLYRKLISILLIIAILGLFSQKIMALFVAQESLNNNVINRMSAISDPIQNQADITGDSRVTILKSAAQEFANAPILGNGLGASHNIEYQGMAMGTHNQYLALLLDMGIAGGVLFAYYFVLLKRNLVKKYKKNFRTYAIALLFFSFFSHTLFEEYSMLFIHAYAWVFLTNKVIAFSSVRIGNISGQKAVSECLPS